MPERLTVTLEGTPPDGPFQHGAGLRALVLGWIAEGDPAMAASLHEANLPKPYSISPLHLPQEPGEPLRFELSILTDWLLEPVLEGMGRSGTAVRLGTYRYELTGCERGAGSSWQALLASSPSGLPQMDFRLLSPTAHHATAAHRKSLVLPGPELYFGSWLHRWNLYAPPDLRLDAGLMERVESSVAVGGCSGHTETVPLDAGRVFLGFVGEVRFTLLKPQEIPGAERAALAALARFATYCGTGVETMRGMGQTRFLSRR